MPNSTHNGYSDVKNGTQPVEIEFLRSPLPPNYHWKFSFADGMDLSFATGRKNLYVVLVNNSGENDSWETMCDMRCS